MASEDKPTGGDDQPGSGDDQPGCGADQPGSGDDQPGSGADQPRSEDEQPGGGDVQKHITFEEILKDVGEFGWYQIRLFIILTLMDVSIAQSMVFFIFSNANPGWWCSRFAGSNTSLAFNESSNLTEGVCELDGMPCVEFVFSDDLVTMTSEWQLVCDKGYIPSMSVSLQMVGVLIGSLVTGQTADWYGRKKTLIVVVFSMLALQTGVGFSNSWQVFTAIRFIEGMAIAGCLCICFTLPMEFIGPRYRTLCGSLGTFGIGTSLLALLAYLMRHWTYVGLTAGLLCIPLLIGIILFVPESVRWLVQRGRFTEAEEVVREMARVNGREVPNLALVRNIADPEKSAKGGTHYSYHDLFRTRTMALRTLVIMFMWSTGSLLLYGINTMFDTFKGSLYTNVALSAIIAMVMGWTIIYTAERWGRRNTYIFYMMFPIVCMVIVVIVGILGLKSEVPDLITVMALLGKGGVSAAWDIATIYVGEIFPTLTRNIGMGAASLAARIGGILAPQVSYLGELTHWTIPYVVYAVMSILCAILVLVIMPETKGKPLPENMPRRKSKV